MSSHTENQSPQADRASSTPTEIEPIPARSITLRHGLQDDTGAMPAEYAITTLAACGFAALLVVILKSEPIRKLITGIITQALNLGG